MVHIKTPELLRSIDDVAKRLDTIEHAADDLRPVWPQIGRLWADREQTVFASGGLGRWAPMAAVTLRTHQSPLVDTGVMRQGLTASQPIWDAKKGAAYGAERSDRRVYNIAVFHTYGTRRMPKRLPVPPLRAAERRAWVDVVADHMRKALD